MDTQTDSQAGMQIHTIVAKHHQQQLTTDNDNESSKDNSGDNIASSSGTPTSKIDNNSTLTSGQRESGFMDSNETNEKASSSAGSSSILQAETTLSPTTNNLMSRNLSMSQSPLALNQFTHHPPQHYHHHHHSSTTTLHHDDDITDSHSPQSPLSSLMDDEVMISPCTDKVPYISTDCVPRKHSGKCRDLGKSPTLAPMPLYLASEPSSQNISRQGSTSSSSARAVVANSDAETFQSNYSESSSLNRSEGDIRNSRISIECNIQTESPLSAVQSTASNMYRATVDDDCVSHSSRDLIGKAHHNASGMAVPLPTTQVGEALPSSPSFTSYCISSTSLDGSRQAEQASSSSSSMSHELSATTTPARHFISPNALLHRRLITQKSALKRSRLSPSKVKNEQFAFSGPLQEQRRSSLGSILSPSSSTSAQRDGPPSSSCITFQLQPVPIGKRKKIRRSSLARKNTSETASNRIEKRLKIDSQARVDSSNSTRQHRGILTSVFKPINSSFDDEHSIRREASLRGREQDKKLHIALAGVNTPSQPRSRISRPKLNRTQSLPNLKAIPEMDMNLAATHRLTLPPRLIDYLSSLRERAQQQQNLQLAATPDGVASTPLHNQDRMIGTSMAAQASSFARNGYCSTTMDSMGNIKSIFIPSLHPPITRQTLKELDLHEILKNPQLRHDIVFDANVQFRPNFDGERGRKKKEFGNKYWYAIQKEIETGCTCTSFNGKMLLPCTCGIDKEKTATSQFAVSLSSIKSPLPFLANYAHSTSNFNGLVGTVTPAQASAKMKSPRSAIGLGAGGRIPSRIPLLIQELRAICLSVLPSPSSGVEPVTPSTAKIHTSVPSINKAYTPSSTSFTAKTPLTASSSVATHHILIAQSLDPLLITQQLQHGLLDIASLMSFLGSILKLHCAPMRDEIIETMIKTVCEDGEVAVGLRMCFEILELMKLDTANHQLRSSRMYLIETAVDFEIRWFRDQLDQRKVNLERTKQWFTLALQEQKSAASSTILTRTKMISKSFDLGLLRLIMNPILDSATSSAAATLPAASLKHAYTNNYPETFQFDAYRLMSFHGDVTDITIVYMLLLLFRQLACSSSNLAQGSLPDTTLTASIIMDNASNIATRQLNNVKNEIWTLLHDADQEISTTGICPSSAGAPKTPTTPAFRLLSQSALSGSHKLENPVWRKAMNDVVLQIAARAIEVQNQARKEPRSQQSALPTSTSPPREETMKMLMSWIETNLRKESPLHKLCQQRLKTVLCALLDNDQSRDRVAKSSRKDREESESVDEKPSKRVRLEGGAASSNHKDDNIQNVNPSKSDVEVAIQKGGLEPFIAEIKLLSERIVKVRSFHLRVFRSLYEKIAGETHQET